MAHAQMVAQVTRLEGQIVTDPNKPDGIMRKLMRGNRLNQLGRRAGDFVLSIMEIN